jgi:hypothetical protein
VHLIISLAAPEPEVRCYRVEEPFDAVELTVRPPVQLHPGGNRFRFSEKSGEFPG